MILTPVDIRMLPGLLAGFRDAIAGQALATAVFDRIAATWSGEESLDLSTDADHPSPTRGVV